ncbi:uncharacterized protein PFLUO_LOCUS541 [Penicillium psychrofluorescens]|uniref:uncharacterized protein n=1 Tax=Penicillium psychrofluorescens TaxID=3158075 RepID=UPI003CCE1CCE
MDINSLLSGDSNSQPGNLAPAPSLTANPNAQSSPGPPSHNKALQRTRSRQAKTSSPLAQQIYAPAGSGSSAPSPPAASPSVGPTLGGGNGTPPSEPASSRQASTPGMDTLADLAAMQHHQPQRPNTATMLRNTESYQSQLSPSTMHPHVNAVSHNTPTPRTSFDIAMADGPRESARRNYAKTSLVPNAQHQATLLFSKIQENPHSYEAHVQFIGLLHAGFVNHVYPPNNPDIQGDPRQYDLLKDMRTAREEMDKLFAMGEDLWTEWIQDESMLARSVEERIAVTELCQRSVEEEYGSTQLWKIYGEWVQYLYYSASGDGGASQWSEEDRLVGREVFTWQSVLDVWQGGADATRWRINNGNPVWDQLLALCTQDISRAPSQEKINHVRSLYDVRLQTPHATWDQTFQAFSSFISTYYNNNYEEIMSETVARASDAKAWYNAREELELKLSKAQETGDRSIEWHVYAEYIDWEVSRSRRKREFHFDLAEAIYQRAVLRFPTDVSLWEDYVMFLIDESMHGHTSTTTISTLHRATRHCPWSGNLWSQYLLSSEREGQGFQKISNIKHQATSTGLLDAGGLEEVLKVHTTWCSYLRRRAFLSDSTDEDLDVAEVGIRSAIESVQELGEKKYGRSYQGDPLFRLERIYIRYLSESGSWDSARETFKGLVPTRGNSYEFWITYYDWELISWSKFVQGEATVDAARRTPNPSYATAVLKQAIKRTDLDWPEKIVQTYITHCEDYEDSDELQLAVLETRKAMRAVNAQREKKAAELLQQQQEQEQQQQQSAATDEQAPSAEKRKREDDIDANGLPAKKARAEEAPPQEDEPVALRRDRENATVVVKNLPHHLSEHEVRQFFRHCGTINSVKMFHGQDGNSEIAIIEFETKEEALGAQIRDQKLLKENTIEVQIGTGSTLFVTNFPATADEEYIRNLFGKYGEIVDIRFPSLKYNTNRRFCYLQFASTSSAHHATEIDGTEVENGLHLLAKISDPTQKQHRTGPQAEGREVYVTNIDFKADEDSLNEAFTRFGHVESVILPRNAAGKKRGFAFVVFSSKEEATEALAMDGQVLLSRQIKVEISNPAGPKRTAHTVISRVKSESPAPVNGTASDDVEVPVGERAERTLALMNVPDTVNDARIRALVEPFGRLIKIVLRPDHQGAIVEFADVQDAGKASMTLEGKEIIPGRHIRIGTVRDLKQQRAEVKTDRVTSIKQEKKPGPTFAQGPIKRPQQPGTRGGRRGGLGLKQHPSLGTTPTSTSSPAGSSDKMDTTADVKEEGTGKPKKSNDDFRAMVTGSHGK